MAGRNRFVDPYYFSLRMSMGLRDLIAWYQKDREIGSLNTTIIELLETHPEVAKRWKIVYNTSIEHREHLEHSEQPINAERDDP